MIKMKKLVSSGVPGANEGYVPRGREFTTTELRARDLEEHGLAYRLDVRPEPKPLTKMEALPSNKAADAGPLGLAGGATGVEAPVPSSPPAPQRRGRRSARSKDAALL